MQIVFVLRQNSTKWAVDWIYILGIDGGIISQVKYLA